MKAYERELVLQNEKSELIRGIRHDMKHHLMEIRSLADNDETETIKKYIEELGMQLNETSPFCDSGNPGLDTVLNYMLQRAVDNDIKISSSIKVPQNINLSVIDMNIILGNLIENAIEANRNIENPSIDVNICYVKDSLVIDISNTYSNTIKTKNKRLISTKLDREKHGYGLKNVQRVLDKYVHTIDIDCSDGRFRVVILMKIFGKMV